MIYGAWKRKKDKNMINDAAIAWVLKRDGQVILANAQRTLSNSPFIIEALSQQRSQGNSDLDEGTGSLDRL